MAVERTLAAGGVTVAQADGIAVVTIANPGKRNAFSTDIRVGLTRELPRLMDDPACRAIVLVGADGCFCSGGDITTFEALPPAPARALLRSSHGYLRPLIQGETPVIAAVEGFAFGAGLGLALACDQIVAADDARFCAAFARIGLMPDAAVTWTLQQRVGIGMAKEMCLLAREVKAAEALEIGLVDEVVPKGGALAAATALGRRFAEMAPRAIGLTKAVLARFPLGFEEALTVEAYSQGLLYATEDMQEGRRAFLEKRAPRFRGE